MTRDNRLNIKMNIEQMKRKCQTLPITKMFQNCSNDDPKLNIGSTPRIT